MARFMVVEHIRNGDVEPVYRRFHQRGRMLPDGLVFIDSWLAADGSRIFQLMETDDAALFETWTPNWNDLIRFEIFEIGAKPQAQS